MDDMRRNYMVTKTSAALDENGHSVKTYFFEYTLPFKAANGGTVESPVCGNAFSWAYGLGKNTRTEYERAIRLELARDSPTSFSSRDLRCA